MPAQAWPWDLQGILDPPVGFTSALEKLGGFKVCGKMCGIGDAGVNRDSSCGW